MSSNRPALRLEAFPWKIILWRNTNDKGYPYHSGTLEKIVRNKDTGKWDTLKWDIQDRDLPQLVVIAQAAFLKTGVTEDESKSRAAEERKALEADIKEAF